VSTQTASPAFLSDHPKSLHLDRAAFHSNLGHTADLVHHIEIALQDGTKSKYHLELFEGNEKIELQSDGSRT